jgi:hypothetical protein
LTVSPTVKDGNALLLLFGHLVAQLRHHLFHGRTQILFIGAIAIQGSQKDGTISIMGGG